MKKVFVPILLVLLSICAHAQLKKFTVEIPNPPKYKISDSIQSFTIMNRSLSNEFQNFNEDSLQISFYRKNFDTNYILLDSTVSDTTIQVLGDLLFNSDRYDIVIPVDRNLPRDISYVRTPEPLDWENVNEICETYRTDALIVLENIATRVVTNYRSGNEYNGFNYAKTHYASMDFYFRAHWRIYDPKSKKIVVDFIMNQDTLFWDNFDYVLTETFNGLPSVKDAAIETGIKIALDFSDIIAPTWTTETRYYYITKNLAVDRSIALAAEGKWPEAYENWLNYSQSGNSSTRSKIMLNLALGSEMNGDIDQAIEWAKKSTSTFYREISNHYLKELLKRKILLDSKH
ncbi:MAG: DUF6340 family protein [Prolixibacteraceae bacterium]